MASPKADNEEQDYGALTRGVSSKLQRGKRHDLGRALEKAGRSVQMVQKVYRRQLFTFGGRTSRQTNAPGIWEGQTGRKKRKGQTQTGRGFGKGALPHGFLVGKCEIERKELAKEFPERQE